MQNSGVNIVGGEKSEDGLFGGWEVEKLRCGIKVVEMRKY